MQTFYSLALKTSVTILKDLERDGLSRGLRLLLAAGIISPVCSGIFHLMNPALRFIQKLEGAIDVRMHEIGGTRVHLSSLAPLSLWESSGRVETIGHELFQLKDSAHRKYCLSPTHEESITSLVASNALASSYKHMPLRLYQITTKYRDEMRPRYGLLRCREFLMKDMYSFDTNSEKALESYSKVCSAYEKIFTDISLPVLKTEADVGGMGGHFSHEFQLPCTLGENVLINCARCKIQANEEILSFDTNQVPTTCTSPNCCERKEEKAIELAHCFYLGTETSEKFGLKHFDQSGQKVPVEMGCYGIGVTRILGALCEHTSKRTPNRICWPGKLAPFQVSVIPLSSKEPNHSRHLERAHEIYHSLDHALRGEIVLDNRMHLMHSYKLKDNSLFGFPYSIVLSDKQGDGAELITRDFGGDEIYDHFDTCIDLVNHLINRFGK